MPANKVLFLHSFAKINIKKENKVYFSFKKRSYSSQTTISYNFNMIRSTFETYLSTCNKAKDSYALCYYLLNFNSNL